MKLGHLIRKTRLQHGLRAYEVAAKAGISPTTLSLIERRGLRPSAEQMKRIIQILGLNANIRKQPS